MRQGDFFQELRRRLGWRTRTEAAEQLAPLLGLSESGCFSRLNGRIKLRFDEIVRIGEHYGIYPADLLRAKEQRTLPYFGTLQRMHEVIDEVVRCRRQGHTLRYTATEIPVFYVLGFPALAAVKLHLWLSLQQPTVGRRVQALQLDTYNSSGQLDALRQLSEDYRHIRRTEIWGESMLDNLLSQVRYLREIGAIQRNEPLYEQIQTEFMLLLDRLQSLVEQPDGPLVVHHNYFHYASNFILRSSGEEEHFVYLPGKNLSFYRLAGLGIVDAYLHEWDQQVRPLEPLAQVSRMEFQRFFRTLQRRMAAVWSN